MPAVKAMPAMEAVPTVEAVAAMKAVAAAPMPAASQRMPWDGTGEEHQHQDDNAPQPWLKFTSTVMPVIHGMLLAPYAHDRCADLQALPCRQPL
jgi:hypothetical protein